jgi:tetratricopeptide (TPR) repeat protein
VSGDQGGWGPPDYPDLDRLDAQAALGRWPEVESGARLAIHRYPDWAGGHQKLSRALFELERYDEAREAVETARGLAPNDYWNLTHLSRIAERQKDSQLALEAAEQAVALAPTSAWTHHRLAQVLLLRTSRHPRSVRDPYGALVAIDRALEIAPEQPAHHSVRAYALKALGRRSEGVAAFREAIRLAPDAHHDVNNLGLMYLRRRPFTAARLFRQSAGLDPTCPNPRNNLTTALHVALHHVTWYLAAAGVTAAATSRWVGETGRLAVVGTGVVAMLAGAAIFWAAVPGPARPIVARRSWSKGLWHLGLLLAVLVADAAIAVGDLPSRVAATALLLGLAATRVAVHRVTAFFPVARRLGLWMVPPTVPRDRRRAPPDSQVTR